MTDRESRRLSAGAGRRRTRPPATRPEAPRHPIAEFEYGLSLLVEGGRFLRREPSLWALAIVPVSFALVAVAVAGALFLANLAVITRWCQSLLPAVTAPTGIDWLWLGPAVFLVWVGSGLAVVVLFGASIVAALLAANLASAPFLERLSNRVESLARGRRGTGEGDEEGGLESIASVGRSFAGELARAGLLAGVWLLLSFFGLVVPGASFVVPPLLVAFTILFLPLEYAGHALDRRGVSFGERLRFVRANLATMAGFGSVAFVACFLPGFNLIVMPALVTAGTLLVLAREPAADDVDATDLGSFSDAET